MDIFTIVWVSLLGIAAVTEGVALFNKRTGDTFSEHVWKWLKSGKDASSNRRRWGLLAIGLGWLSVHFLSDGWI